MAGGSDDLPMLGGEDDPSRYESQSAKERFAVAKFYGMGTDGEWTVPEIAEAMDVHERTVYRYLNESQIGEETRQVLATTEAEWRLDMALQLRKEVERLEETEQELRQRKKAVPTGFEQKTVEGTPTGDRNIRLADDADSYRLKLPVPRNFETVTDVSSDLQAVIAEKRQYLDQIADLLGLDETAQEAVDQTLATRHEEVKIVEYRQSDDPYPDAEPVDMDTGDPIDVEAQDVADPSDDAPDGGDA